MINHVSLNISDFTKGKEFYSKALAPLGYSILSEYAEWSVAGLGEPGKPDLWIHAQGPVTQTTHIALAGKDKAAVDAFYQAALYAGATDNGAPGYRKEYAPGYYAAFVKDTDGHNIEVVFMDPAPTV